MRPLEWIKQILERHGLDKPDGRPLYQYRLTEEEFEELEKLLKLSSHLGFQNVSRLMLMWDAALVIYASEWWRREYSGQWSWEGIFLSLNLDTDDISTGLRNDIIQNGLNRWHRSVRKIGGRRHFLGTVATEGGLPLNRLKDAGGWLNNILRPIIRRHISRGVDIATLLEAYSDAIPKSYQSKEILQILEDLVNSVADLRGRHDFSDRADPVAWLDEQEPSWRDVFPLPLESEVAKSLLMGLIQEAAKIKALDAQATDAFFQLDRFLVNETIEPAIKAKLEVPSFIPVEFFKQLGLSDNAARFDFEVSNDLGERWLWCRGFKTVKQEQAVFKLTGKPLLFENHRALSELTLKVKAGGETLGVLPIISSQWLNQDEPWMFICVGGRWELQGTATQKTKHEEAIVYIPAELEVKLKDDANLITLRSSYQGSFYSLSGTVTCGSQLDNSFFVLSTKDRDSCIQYELVGKQYNGISSPSKVFIGLPHLLARNTLTGHLNRKPLNNVCAKLVGVNSSWHPLKSNLVGVYELKLLDDMGAVLCKRRVGLLPESFKVKLEADRRNAKAGKILLEGLPAASVTCQTQELSVHNSYDADSSVHSISLESTSLPPHSVEFDILPPSHRQEIRLQIPFPCKGAILYSPQGDFVPVRQPLNLNELHGYRIKIFNDRVNSAHTAQLRFSLNDSTLGQQDLRDLYINKQINLKETITELSLIEWFDVFQEMLGVSASLDSSVRLSVVFNGQDMLSVNVYRYDCDLTPDWNEGTLALEDRFSASLTIDQLANVKIDAILLNQPEQKSWEVLPVQSEGVDLGVWDFQSHRRSQGLWLVFPTPDSDLSFRPLLWVVRNNEALLNESSAEHVESLQQAVLIQNPVEREGALRAVVRKMALDVNHQGWKYLEILNERCGHLPLATFDIWRVAVSEPSFLACLIVKNQFEDVIDRIESELPILWELVHISHWEQALNGYRSYLIQSMCHGDKSVDEAVHLVIQEFILKIIQRIEGLGASMQSICTLLKYSVLKIETKELYVLRMPFEVFVKGDLEHNFQDMINRNSNSDWPVLLQQGITEKFDLLPKELKSVIKPYHRFQHAASFLPAVLAARLLDDDDVAWLGSAVNIFKLDQLKEFDHQWFTSAFQAISGWMYFQGQDNKA